VESKPLNLSAEERLDALRSLDIFHPWETVDEERLCRRCGNIITGRQVKIRCHSWGGKPTRLECPTEGCLGVPLEWIMLESPVQCDPAPLPSNHQTSAKIAPVRNAKPEIAPVQKRMFEFLRVPPVLF
jgi:hypothetical protein